MIYPTLAAVRGAYWLIGIELGGECMMRREVTVVSIDTLAMSIRPRLPL